MMAGRVRRIGRNCKKTWENDVVKLTGMPSTGKAFLFTQKDRCMLVHILAQFYYSATRCRYNSERLPLRRKQEVRLGVVVVKAAFKLSTTHHYSSGLYALDIRLWPPLYRYNPTKSNAIFSNIQKLDCRLAFVKCIHTPSIQFCSNGYHSVLQQNTPC